MIVRPPGPASVSTPWSLIDVVNQICAANADLPLGGAGKFGRRALPSRDAVAGVVTGLRAALFPWHFGASDLSDEGLAYYVGRTLEASLSVLDDQVRIGLLFDCTHGEDPCETCARRAQEVTRELASRLPHLRRLLGMDALAAYDGDPAATSLHRPSFPMPG